MNTQKKIIPPFQRTPHNYDTNQVSDDTGLECKDESLTQQQFQEECDINYIAEKFGLTGELPTVLQTPRYGDFTGIFDFQSAQNAVVKAQNDFLTLPAKLRARFNNEPQKLLEFLEDPANRQEAEFLGLVKRKEEPSKSLSGAPAPTDKPGTPTPASKAPEKAQDKKD